MPERHAERGRIVKPEKLASALLKTKFPTRFYKHRYSSSMERDRNTDHPWNPNDLSSMWTENPRCSPRVSILVYASPKAAF